MPQIRLHNDWEPDARISEGRKQTCRKEGYVQVGEAEVTLEVGREALVHTTSALFTHAQGRMPGVPLNSSALSRQMLNVATTKNTVASRTNTTGTMCRWERRR